MAVCCLGLASQEIRRFGTLPSPPCTEECLNCYFTMNTWEPDRTTGGRHTAEAFEAVDTG